MVRVVRALRSREKTLALALTLTLTLALTLARCALFSYLGAAAALLARGQAR